jgi:hypothetical protein
MLACLSILLLFSLPSCLFFFLFSIWILELFFILMVNFFFLYFCLHLYIFVFVFYSCFPTSPEEPWLQIFWLSFKIIKSLKHFLERFSSILLLVFNELNELGFANLKADDHLKEFRTKYILYSEPSLENTEGNFLAGYQPQSNLITSSYLIERKLFSKNFWSPLN